MLRFKINWVTYFRRLGVSFLLLIIGIGYFIYNFNELEKVEIVFYSLFGILTLFETSLYFFITKQVSLNDNEICHLEMWSNKEIKIDFSKISHFMYHENSILKSDFRIQYEFIPTLTIFLKSKYEPLNSTGFHLCLFKKNRYLLLSELYRKGFDVIMFDSLRPIQDTEFFVEEIKEVTS